MKMSKTDIRKYPKLAYYVKVNLPQVVHVPAIVQALKKIANLNDVKLRDALIWGKGPQIKVTYLVDAYGEFSPNQQSNEIRIDTSLVTDFEKGRGKRMARAGSVYLVGITLLHELTHWGDDQNGIDRPGEEGEEFEKLVYGKLLY